MILFYDTETNGLTQTQLSHEHPAQPDLVQLGMILADPDPRCPWQYVERASFDAIVKPNGWRIPERAAQVHGITTEMAERLGTPLALHIAAFAHFGSIANEIVAWNMPFDDLVMRTAVFRNGRPITVRRPTAWTCAMSQATPVLNLPPPAKMQAAGFLKNKPPNLKEAHRFFFGEDFVGAHAAISDARAAMRCFFEMRKRENQGDEHADAGT